ncbi:hypothetical protein EBMC1_14750 [Sphingopyxis sp. MC1]|nr:hypothetical protein EBMC1_14750 [Sphingopyxis sp. MC1]
MVGVDHVFQWRFFVVEAEYRFTAVIVLSSVETFQYRSIGFLKPLVSAPLHVRGHDIVTQIAVFGIFRDHHALGERARILSHSSRCPWTEIQTLLIAIRKFGRVIGRTAYKERLAFVASTGIDCNGGATVDADTYTGLEVGMIFAKALHHLAKCRREGHRNPYTLALVFSPIWSKDHGMEAGSVKIDSLHFKLVDEFVAATVMGVEKF